MGPESPRRQQVTVVDRPLIEPEWDLVRRFVQRTQRDDLRLRFGRPLNLEDEPTLRRAFDIKAGVGEIAWALDEGAAITGIAHRIMVSNSEAEVGLLVRSDLQRRGIGEMLLRDLLARAARQGIRTLSALVLRENRAVLRLAAKFGGRPRAFAMLTVDLTLDVSPSAPTI